MEANVPHVPIIDKLEVHGEQIPTLTAYEDEIQDLWFVLCDSCLKFHQHGAGSGHRGAHCISDGKRPDSPYEHTGYILVYGGPLTDAVRTAAVAQFSAIRHRKRQEWKAGRPERRRQRREERRERSRGIRELFRIDCWPYCPLCHPEAERLVDVDNDPRHICASVCRCDTGMLQRSEILRPHPPRQPLPALVRPHGVPALSLLGRRP
jgi:hypothetical protein